MYYHVYCLLLMMGCVAVLIFVIMFLFFKQKTAYEMRISDWSSDVCSSDLVHRIGACPVDAGRGSRTMRYRKRRGREALGVRLSRPVAGASGGCTPVRGARGPR